MSDGETFEEALDGLISLHKGSVPLSDIITALELATYALKAEDDADAESESEA